MSKLTDKTKDKAEKLRISIGETKEVCFYYTCDSQGIQDLINFLEVNKDRPYANLRIDGDYQVVSVFHWEESTEEEVLEKIDAKLAVLDSKKKEIEERAKNKIEKLEAQLAKAKKEAGII